MNWWTSGTNTRRWRWRTVIHVIRVHPSRRRCWSETKGKEAGINLRVWQQWNRHGFWQAYQALLFRISSRVRNLNRKLLLKHDCWFYCIFIFKGRNRLLWRKGPRIKCHVAVNVWYRTLGGSPSNGLFRMQIVMYDFYLTRSFIRPEARPAGYPKPAYSICRDYSTQFMELSDILVTSRTVINDLRSILE